MFSSDKPVSGCGEDALGRAGFAEKLTQAILAYEGTDCLTVGLCGRWGSGKTSILNMMAEQIGQYNGCRRAEERLILVPFEPWNYTDRNQLIVQFFRAISDRLALSDDSRARQRLAEIILQYGDTINLLSLMPAVGQYATLGSVAAKIASRAFLAAGMKRRDLTAQRAYIRQELERLGQKVLITIDDIDRLNNEQICLIFQLVNSVASFPNVIYLLSFDRDVVARALEKEQNGDGRKYLEKIIQVPFDVPEVSGERVEQIFSRQLMDILSPDDNRQLEQSSYWNSVFDYCISPFLNNVRDVNRICNLFRFKYGIMKGEVNWIDLLALTAVEVCEDGLYQWIVDSRKALTGSFFSRARSTAGNGEREWYTGQFEKLFAERAARNMRVVQTLFPYFAWLTAQFGGESVSDDELLRDRRLACGRIFPLFFSLSLEPIAIPRETLDELLLRHDRKELEAFLWQGAPEGEISQFIREVRVRAESIPEERTGMLFELMADWPGAAAGRPGVEMLRDDRCEACLRLLRRMGKEKSLQELTEGAARSGAESVTLYAQIAEITENAYGRMGDSRGSRDQIVPEDCLPALEEAMLAAFRRNAGSAELFRQPRFDAVLRLWGHLDAVSFKAYMDQCLKEPVNVPYFLQRYMGTWFGGKRSGFHFGEGTFGGHAAAEDLYRAVCALPGTADYLTLPEEMKNTTAAFKLWYETREIVDRTRITDEMVARARAQWEEGTGPETK